MQINATSLISALDDTLSRSSSSKSATILRDMLRLFTAEAKALTTDCIAIFDDILIRLVDKVDEGSLIELSDALAAVPNAPPKTANQLARHRNIAVSGPLLRTSPVISEQTLADVVKGKNPAQVDAIIARDQIPDSVTDVLVEQGEAETVCKLIRNPAAAISVRGFVKLIRRAENEPTLAADIAERADLPYELRAFLRLPAA